jgi:hypothetical protein
MIETDYERLRRVADASQTARLEAIERHGGVRRAAIELGVHHSALSRMMTMLKLRAVSTAVTPRNPAEELHIPYPPDSCEPISELIARKAAQFKREGDVRSFNKLVHIGVKARGPVAIAAVGDPHVDDDGCDVQRLVDDMRVIGVTEGMYALHLGDITNNWVGRLGRLYAHQSTKASDGIRLAEHIFSLAPPLAVVAGNHDLWNEGMSWLRFCVQQAGVDASLLQPHGVRMELAFPGGKTLRIHARHDFPGHSQYNPVHGLRKEHLFGMRDHINIAGHKHIDSYSVVPSPDGYMQHMLRVSGYKAHDDYAAERNLQPMKMAPTVALVIDPDAQNPAELVKPFWDLGLAADYLRFMRGRA